MSIASVNPATGAVLRTFAPISEDEIDQKLATAEQTFRTYRKTPFFERSKWMLNAAEILESEKEELGKLMTMEMGKPLKAAREEAAKCAWVCRFYAENAERFLSDELVQTNASQSYVHYQALGPILAVMPWNFPFWQVFRLAAPALMAGNVALLKHASNVPQCALSIEDVIRRSGFPQGAFQTLLISSNQVKRVLEDPRIKAATLTGSEPAGSDVASTAGRNIKKTVLELGGSDPFIVMPTANLDESVKTAVKARCINNGQSCIAAKRFIVHDKIADEFEQQFVKGMEALKVGDPLVEDTDVGPLATAQLLEQLDQQVQKTVSAGARLLTGGKKLNRPGNYYAPTVLTNIPKNSPAYHEEIFGPVALLLRIRNIDEAISLANDTTFGLGGAAWTNDEDEKQQFIDGIEAGAVFINGMVASDPRLPFGGVKHSGYGRELGVFGIREFMNIKTVWVK
jgi:succinate-semialdehyde dehydrogenase/glutarate-semialdehyde dehydrogenase